MSKLVIVLIVIGVLIGAGYLLFGQGGKFPSLPGTTPSQPTASLPKQVEVALDSQNNSNQLGTATLQKVDGKLVVKIVLKGQPAGSSEPAHIHQGSCPNPGVVKYPLSPVVNGASETTLNITGDELLKLMPLAVNVHKSEADSKTYVACGNVEL